MLELLKFPDDFQKSTGLNQLWYKDAGTTTHIKNNIGFGVRQQYITQKSDPKGTFSFRVPLKHIFGFCDDYEKVVYGLKHKLTLVRKGDHDAIFKTGAVAAGPENNPPAIAEPDDRKIVLTKLSCICHMLLQICKKNLHSTKQLHQNQVSQLVTE